MLNIRRRMFLPIALRSTRWSAAHDVLKPTPFLRAGFWLLACIIVCWLGWRRSGSREAAFVLAVCGSATIYVLSFYAVGVASDFRYGYWAVLAAIAGGVVAAVR